MITDELKPNAHAPLVSVLTTSYQHRRWLQETLRSVERQDYPNVEHIVVDDGSTDGSTEILADSGGGGLRWCSTPHVGQAAALNEAFRQSTGEIIGWLSSDDAYYDRRVISDVVDVFAAHPDAGVVFGHAVLIDENGLQLQAEWVPPAAALGRRLPLQIYQPAAFVRRSAVGDTFVDESFHIAMDTELWLRVRATRRLVRLGRILAAERHQSTRKSYVLGSEGAAEAERLAQSYGFEQGRSINRRNRAWGVAYRIAGVTLIPQIRRIPSAFNGSLDGRLALVVRQLAVPRSRMGQRKARR